MAELSPEMMARLKTFRQAKRLRDRQRTGQVVGGLGGTLLGDPMAFERLAPERLLEAERARFMAQKEQEARVAAQLGQQEQYYFGKEQEERRTVLSDIAQEMQRLSQIAQTDARLAQSGAQARANLQGRAKLERAQQTNADLLQSYGLTPAAMELEKQLTRQYKFPKPPAIGPLNDAYEGGAIIQRLRVLASEGDALAQKDLKRLEAEERIGSSPTGDIVASPGVRAVDLARSLKTSIDEEELVKARMDGRQKARAEQERRIQATAQDPSTDIDAALLAVEQSRLSESDKHNLMLNISPDEDRIRQVLGVDSKGADRWGLVKTAHQTYQDTKERTLDTEMGDYIRTAGQTFGGRVERYLGDLPSLSERYDQAKEMAKKSSALRGKDEDGDGIPDVDWAPDAPGRFIQILDQIEQYPDQPPVKWAKQQIMGSPQFSEFMKQYGYEEDPDYAFKEMNRMARRQQRSTKAKLRRRTRENIRQGIGGYAGMARPGFTPTGDVVQETAEPKKKPASTNLVTGATGSRIAEN